MNNQSAQSIATRAFWAGDLGSLIQARQTIQNRYLVQQDRTDLHALEAVNQLINQWTNGVDAATFH